MAVNLNYQIVPFRPYPRVLQDSTRHSKAETHTAVAPHADANIYLRRPGEYSNEAGLVLG